MPWSTSTFEGVCAGLRRSAQEGDFVPFKWTASIEDNGDGGCRFRGCGWGIVGWFAAIMEGGAGWAKRMLPVGCTQDHVNQVLLSVGLTRAEIDLMEPEVVWSSFDHELSLAYANRDQDWGAYIDRSMQLAEYFIWVLERVEVSDEVITMHLPFLPPAPESDLPLFTHQAFVLDEKYLVAETGLAKTYTYEPIPAEAAQT